MGERGKLKNPTSPLEGRGELSYSFKGYRVWEHLLKNKTTISPPLGDFENPILGGGPLGPEKKTADTDL